MPAIPSASPIGLFLDRLPEGKLLWRTPFDSGRVQPSRWHDYRTWTSHTTSCRETDKPRLPNPGTAQEAVVSSRTRPFASTLGPFRQAIQEMSGVETLVVGSRVPLHDLPSVLMVKDSLPNLSAITLVAPSLDNIAPFMSSVVARNGIPDVKRIESLEILCQRYEEDLVAEAVKRPLEGDVSLVEVRSVRDGGDVWVKSMKRTIEREFFG